VTDVPTRRMQPFIANTDDAWFEFLRARAAGGEGRLDEVNFWQPRSQRPVAKLAPGHPFFFRLKAPRHKIAGYGFFASFSLLRLDQAWEFFGERNGDPDQARFLARIGRYRKLDLLRTPTANHEPLGCTILRDAVFWPEDRWLAWGAEQGWARNIVQGKAERDPIRASELLGEIQFDHLETPQELSADRFEPLDVDDRHLVLARAMKREGQGTFRARLLDAYGRRCAITGEHTEIVLDAAHIQPYLGPRSNHVQNGLLLTKEFHKLFDAGYVTVTPELVVKVSPRLAGDWANGKRYYAYDERPLTVEPDGAQRPSPAVLGWHGARVFLAG
jgi:putative restriction endonuclease